MEWKLNTAIEELCQSKNGCFVWLCFFGKLSSAAFHCGLLSTLVDISRTNHM